MKMIIVGNTLARQNGQTVATFAPDVYTETMYEIADTLSATEDLKGMGIELGMIPREMQEANSSIEDALDKIGELEEKNEQLVKEMEEKLNRANTDLRDSIETGGRLRELTIKQACEHVRLAGLNADAEKEIQELKAEIFNLEQKLNGFPLVDDHDRTRLDGPELDLEYEYTGVKGLQS